MSPTRAGSPATARSPSTRPRSGTPNRARSIDAEPLRDFPTEGDAMSDRLPQVYLARHGETAWTLSGQHTGLTDLPLTPRGEQDARRLGARLKGLTFSEVLTSSLQRARRTGELAGFPAAVVDPELVEW